LDNHSKKSSNNNNTSSDNDDDEDEEFVFLTDLIPGSNTLREPEEDESE
jgi:mannose/fructose-specific phosphotransferase system component IIA